MSSSRTYEHFSKNLVRCNVFFCGSTAVNTHSVFVPTFLCFLRHVSSWLRRRWLESKSPPPWNTFLVCIHEHTVNLRWFHQSLPPRLSPWKLPNVAARMLEAGAYRWAVQRVQLHGSGAPDFSNFSETRAEPTAYETIPWLGWVPPGVVCHLEASVGSTTPAKERRVLNDPKGFWGADFDKIPVSIILDVIVHTAFFVLWAMQHRWYAAREGERERVGARWRGRSCASFLVEGSWGVDRKRLFKIAKKKQGQKTRGTGRHYEYSIHIRSVHYHGLLITQDRRQ